MGQTNDEDRMIRDAVAAMFMARDRAGLPPGARAALGFSEAEAYMAERAIWRAREEQRWAKDAEKAVATAGMMGPNEAGFPTPWRVETEGLVDVVQDATGKSVLRLSASQAGVRNLLEWIVAMVNSCAD